MLIVFIVLYNVPLLLLSPFSHVRLCDPVDGSPPGSPVPGILQTRILEWVAISFSNIPLDLLYKWKFIHFWGAGAGVSWSACRTSQTRGWTCAPHSGSAAFTTGPPGKSKDVCTFWLPSTRSPCSHSLHLVTESLMFSLWVCFWNIIVLQHYVSSC